MAIVTDRATRKASQKGKRGGKTCRCGFDREHPMVQPKLHFSAIKWVLLCFGATPYPTWIEYQCSRCETTLETTDDPKVMATF